MRPPRLLVIDDEPAMRETVCELLRFLGYDVEAARDEADGLARLARERFDLVVTDLRMPQLDGWDVLESAREIAPGMPVIMVTGTAMDEDLERARAYGVRLLSKPVDLRELKAAVRETLASTRGVASSDTWPQRAERHADRGDPGR